MEHTLALIEKAHEGDKAARDTLAEENIQCGKAFFGTWGGDGGSVPDREHWAVEGD